MNNSSRAIVLESWNILITIGFYFMGIQMLLMTDSILVFFLAYMLPGCVYLALRKLKQAVLANKIRAKSILGILIILHVLPLLKQLFGVIDPTIDTIFTAVVALVLLLAL